MSVSPSLLVGTTNNLHSYVCRKISAHLGPIPRRVLLGEIQTDETSPFARRTLHHDLMDALCSLESSGAIIVGPFGLELSSKNLV